MNYGRFFVLDMQTSELAEGIAVFNYKSLKAEDKKSDKTPQYPVYLTITHHSIDFKVHYYNEEGEQLRGEHLHCVILSLPLCTDSDIKDELTEKLNGIFNIPFPHIKNNYLNKLLRRQLKKTEEAGQGITYSSLSVFGIQYKRLPGREHNIIGLIRKLFLDFLFDLEHTDVFCNSIYYESILKLYQNYLFTAISNKAKYFYYREQLKQPALKSVDWIEFNVSYLVEAEKNWVNTIKDSRSDQSFYESDWFLNSEQEMNRIFLNHCFINCCLRKCGLWKEHLGHSTNNIFARIHRKIFTKKIRQLRELKIGEIVRRKKEICLKNEEENEVEREEKYRFWDIFLKVYLKIVKRKTFNRTLPDYNKLLIKQHRDIARGASRWYIHRYAFGGTFRIWSGNNIIGLIAWSILLFCTLIFASPYFNEFFGNSKVGEAFLDFLANVPSQLQDWKKALLILLTVFIVLKGIKRYVGMYMGVGMVNIFFPRLLASIVAAWFALTLSEDLFKVFFDTDIIWRVVVGLLVVTLFFVYYEINKLNPYSQWWHKTLRTITLILIGFCYSFGTGLFAMTFLGERFMMRHEYLSEFYEEYILTDDTKYEFEGKNDFVIENFYRHILLKQDTLLFRQIVNVIDSLENKCDSAVIDSRKIKDTVKKLQLVYGEQFKNFSLCLVDYFNGLGKDVIRKDTCVAKGLAEIKPHIEKLWMDKNRLKLACADSVTRWKTFLERADQNVIYWNGLFYLYKKGIPMIQQKTIIRFNSDNSLKVILFRNFLFQFTFLAMFIGIFLQLIIEEKPVTEPL